MKAMLSKEGPELSLIVAGVMNWGPWGANLDEKAIGQLIMGCLEEGISSFDHADIYGGYRDEALFGRAFKDLKIDRSHIQLISKCGIKLVSDNRPTHKLPSYDQSAAHIRMSAENSLKNLNTEYLDLLLLHRPSPLMDPVEIAEEFTRLKEEGKVRHFGVSNFTPSQFSLLSQYFPLCTNQLEISLSRMDAFHDGSLDQLMGLGIKPMAWSPMGGLFGRNTDDRKARIVNKAQEIADRHSCGIDEIILAFLHKHPSGIIPVIGSSRIERIKKAKASLKIHLETEEWFELWSASTGTAVP